MKALGNLFAAVAIACLLLVSFQLARIILQGD